MALTPPKPKQNAHFCSRVPWRALPHRAFWAPSWAYVEPPWAHLDGILGHLKHILGPLRTCCTLLPCATYLITNGLTHFWSTTASMQCLLHAWTVAFSTVLKAPAHTERQMIPIHHALSSIGNLTYFTLLS